MIREALEALLPPFLAIVAILMFAVSYWLIFSAVAATMHACAIN